MWEGRRVGNFDQFWAETMAVAAPAAPQPVTSGTTTLERPVAGSVPVPRTGSATPSAPRPAALSPLVGQPARALAVLPAPRRGRAGRGIALAGASLAVVAVVGGAALTLGGDALPQRAGRPAALPGSGPGLVSTPAGPWAAHVDGLTAAVRAAGVNGVVTAVYAGKRPPNPALVATGRGRLDGAFSRVAAGLAGADGAVGISATYVARGVTAQCGDVTAMGRPGVLCVWPGGAVWAPGSTRVGDVSAFAAEMARGAT